MKKTSLIVGLVTLMLMGCGQKGPLYLPQPAKPSPDAPKTTPEPVKPEPKPDSKTGSAGY